MKKKSTDELLNMLNSIDKVHDLQAFSDTTFPEGQACSFHEYINSFLIDSGMSASTLVAKSQIQRNYCYQILNGSKKPGRDKVIALCLTLRMPLSDTQRALILADESSLYPKKKRDSILIFAVNQSLSVQETNELLFKLGESTLS